MIHTQTQKRYPDLHHEGILKRRAEAAAEILKDCTLCPHACHVDRTAGERGFCRTGERLIVSGFSPHYGEEEPLVGKRGSGTIFFTHCNLACVYCQNYDISQEGRGYEISPGELAGIMLKLQEMGCHNINLVSPTHQVTGILGAIDIAAGHGLTIPIVYNTGGYDAVTTLKLLDGVIDIYMPDAKYGEGKIANDLSGAPDYVEKMHEALKEMHRQVGNLVIRDGIAERGMIIRHLVLPDDLAGTREVVAFIAEEISPDAYLNIMPQYRPAFRVESMDQRYRSLQRRITPKEFDDALMTARSYGLWRGFDTTNEL
ncbi:radical SAM protein [Methanocalculus chunghsingensis]|uniref:Radical SAM protein n=1 Tax=Methanocalculus chunghsingensis TaxID=156457 RepID=A0A8J7W5Q0_9EURY|nr:radical SAM protein [Methanocalculus chunghsingensis]MBR1368033.1 radical SAM protein [Methanocalculus chunghsingensis]